MKIDDLAVLWLNGKFYGVGDSTIV